MALFVRSKGEEICVSQTIIGPVQYAESNLDFIKDHFTFKSQNRWERGSSNNYPFKIVATFERKDSQFPTYFVTYELQPDETK